MLVVANPCLRVTRRLTGCQTKKQRCSQNVQIDHAGHVGCAQELLVHGASPDLKCEGSAPLHIVASSAALPGGSQQAVALATLLTTHNSSVYTLCAQPLPSLSVHVLINMTLDHDRLHEMSLVGPDSIAATLSLARRNHLCS
jgi:hypothetical protein